MKEKLIELIDLLNEGLKRYGFLKKRKYTYQRKIEGGLQQITFSLTKIRGKEETLMDVYTGFNYPELNKVICFLGDEEYKKTMFTAFINVGFLINPREPYKFYITQFTDVVPIAENILTNIEKVALPFLETCNTLEKYESMLLGRNEAVRRSSVRIWAWDLLALSLLLNRQNSDELIEEYRSEFEKNVYARNINLPETAKEQIKKYNQFKGGE
ncbi:MAG: hypothetical protein NC429_15665 [Lachnospiraceae bacterium]|nr:hypothetical protein [Lachnospiraceae bacterium]